MAVDLYSLGKTVQFLLACTESYADISIPGRISVDSVYPEMSANGRDGNGISNLKDARKDLPREKKSVRSGRRLGKNSNRGKYILGVAGIAAVILVGMFLTREPTVSGENGTLDSSAQGGEKGRKTGAVKVAKISEEKSGGAIFAEQGKRQGDKLNVVFEEKGTGTAKCRADLSGVSENNL